MSGVVGWSRQRRDWVTLIDSRRRQVCSAARHANGTVYHIISRVLTKWNGGSGLNSECRFYSNKFYFGFCWALIFEIRICLLIKVSEIDLFSQITWMEINIYLCIKITCFYLHAFKTIIRRNLYVCLLFTIYSINISILLTDGKKEEAFRQHLCFYRILCSTLHIYRKLRLFFRCATFL